MPSALQDKRLLFRVGFFILFVLAPPLDLFRLDLTQGHFILLGMDWTLGLDAFQRGEIGPGIAAFNLLLRGFLPIALLGGGLLWISWRYGRLYCGWLCPHFSIVELINSLMLRASGKPTIWEKQPLPERQPDGQLLKPDRRYWPVTFIAVLLFSLLWAVTLLTYLLPPVEIYNNLFSAQLTRNQAVFIGVGTLAFMVEFLFARHLFCRYGCAVGLFQSLAWMANKHAMVVSFEGQRASACADCNAACDNACPMRLKPRSIKRKMFTCTQCAQCISACTEVQAAHQAPSLLQWVEEESALQVSDRRPARAKNVDKKCFHGITLQVDNALPKQSLNAVSTPQGTQDKVLQASQISQRKLRTACAGGCACNKAQP